MGTSISSGVKSADALIATGRNRVNAITVLTDGTNSATLDVRDGTTVSGTIKITGKCVGASLINHIIFENPVLFENGIYGDVTGTGATYIIYFGG
mgnify:CR=1 FL=1